MPSRSLKDIEMPRVAGRGEVLQLPAVSLHSPKSSAFLVFAMESIISALIASGQTHMPWLRVCGWRARDKIIGKKHDPEKLCLRAQDESRALIAKHLERRHALDSETYANVGNLYPPY